MLQDGSIWEVAPEDNFVAALWLPLSEVSVLPHDTHYVYQILNLDTLDRVEVRYRGERIP